MTFWQVFLYAILLIKGGRSEEVIHITTETNGDIFSTNYPRPYPSDEDKEWRMSQEYGKWQIILQDFYLQNSKGCSKDYLEINEENIQPKRLCGRKPKQSIISAGSKVRLHFHSDDQDEARGFRLTVKRLMDDGHLRAPQDLKAVALDTQIIVKWTANQDIGLQETFFIEYRKQFESQWSRVSAEYKSTAIINGLQPGAVYFLRLYSKTAAGKTSKSDVTIVKTEKQHSMVKVFTVELALIFGVMFLMMALCRCGLKALKYKQRSSRNQDRAIIPPRNDDTSIRPVHYDEIDSMYYNPINSTFSHQDTRNNVQNCTCQPLNANLEDWEANNISSRNVHCADQQFKPSEEDNSLRSSSDESYLVPCRNYIDLDIVKITENEHQDISIEEPEINEDESSISSYNSETNIKSIRRYETLKISDINEHCYKKYNDVDV